MTCSCGDSVFAFEGGDPAVGVAAVAVGDVVRQCALGGVPVGVVGVVEDELLDRAEVALDPVQVAGVGGGRDKLDPVGVGGGADVGGPVRADPLDDSRPPCCAKRRQARGSVRYFAVLKAGLVCVVDGSSIRAPSGCSFSCCAERSVRIRAASVTGGL